MATTTESGKQKTFKYYLELPSEVRMVINDEMSPDDRCRFTRCSSLCSKEVKKSKEYMYYLNFTDWSQKEEFLEIEVGYERKFRYSYKMAFQAETDKKSIKYSKRADYSWTESWSIDLDISTDLLQLATEHFRKLLNSYQNTIRRLEITGKKNYDFEICSLRNLKSLEITTCVGNIVEVISKREKALECFEYKGEMDDKLLLGSDELIYRVDYYLYIPKVKLNIEQFRRLSAQYIVMAVGELTPTDIFNLIEDWKNGKHRESLYHCTWMLIDSNFEIQQLWRLLNVLPTGSLIRESFEIKHNKNDIDIGRVEYTAFGSRKRLEFMVY